MGTCIYRDGDLGGPALVKWDTKINALMALPLPVDPKTMALDPATIFLDAKEVRRREHDLVAIGPKDLLPMDAQVYRRLAHVRLDDRFNFASERKKNNNGTLRSRHQATTGRIASTLRANVSSGWVSQ